ncbi:hypothetical protein MOQ_005274 [Trypanosoma cruzi marinkellei]|uniref:Dynein heavy chain coiled coil stalk domain-containing protein n=1 Tax=Trypanosoma cruzi marinkellei TaxID=85056 RepID=K2MYM5_TRYCR|nr:hypothetical protein MOQ_005274 [Trypanosoma cruzi marinkellei]
MNRQELETETVTPANVSFSPSSLDAPTMHPKLQLSNAQIIPPFFDVGDLISYEYFDTASKNLRCELATVLERLEENKLLVEPLMYEARRSLYGVVATTEEGKFILEKLRNLEKGIAKCIKDAKQSSQEIWERRCAVQKEKQEVEEAVIIAEEELGDVRTAVKRIDIRHWHELVSYRTPPDIVVRVMAAVVLVLGERRRTWAEIMPILHRPGITELLATFDSSELTQAQREEVLRRYINTPKFTYEGVMKGSVALTELYRWVVAHVLMINVSEHRNQMSRLHERRTSDLEELEQKLQEEFKKIARLNSEINALWNRLYEVESATASNYCASNNTTSRDIHSARRHRSHVGLPERPHVAEIIKMISGSWHYKLKSERRSISICSVMCSLGAAPDRNETIILQEQQSLLLLTATQAKEPQYTSIIHSETGTYCDETINTKVIEQNQKPQRKTITQLQCAQNIKMLVQQIRKNTEEQLQHQQRILINSIRKNTGESQLRQKLLQDTYAKEEEEEENNRNAKTFTRTNRFFTQNSPQTPSMQRRLKSPGNEKYLINDCPENSEDVIATLERQLQERDDALAALKDRLEQYSREKSALESRSNESADALAAVERQLQERDDALAALKDRLEQYSREKSALESRSNESADALAAVERQLQERDDALAALKDRLEQYSREKSALESRSNESADTVVTLERQLQERDGALAALKDRLEQYSREKSALESRSNESADALAAVERQLQERDDAFAAVERQLQERDDALAALKDRLEQYSREKSALESRSNESADTVVTLERQLQERDGALAALKDRLEQYSREKSALESRSNESADALAAVERQLQERDDALAALKDRLEEYRREKSALESRSNESADALAAVERQLQERDDALAALKDRLEEYSREKSALESRSNESADALAAVERGNAFHFLDGFIDEICWDNSSLGYRLKLFCDMFVVCLRRLLVLGVGEYGVACREGLCNFYHVQYSFFNFFFCRVVDFLFLLSNFVVGWNGNENGDNEDWRDVLGRVQLEFGCVEAELHEFSELLRKLEEDCRDTEPTRRLQVLIGIHAGCGEDEDAALNLEENLEALIREHRHRVREMKKMLVGQSVRERLFRARIDALGSGLHRVANVLLVVDEEVEKDKIRRALEELHGKHYSVSKELSSVGRVLSVLYALQQGREETFLRSLHDYSPFLASKCVRNAGFLTGSLETGVFSLTSGFLMATVIVTLMYKRYSLR